ncbi:protein phosphatase 2C domain-containing protein [Mycobacterium sp. pW045]|uniref:protein phosphatase 2C domain-containing protein n=1 Tax=Mycobacterium sp. pW045 TaxID=3238984 RepID=UPI00351B5691
MVARGPWMPTSFDPTPAAPHDWVGTTKVIGPLAIPQISVGTPSPSGEPVAISAEFRSFPFRPDVVLDGWSTDTVTIRGVSQRGHMHRHNGAPRQDDFAIHQLPGRRVIAVVADGVSGARQSHVGAGTAVRYAADWLRSNLGDDVAHTDWQLLYKNVAWALAEQAKISYGLDEPDPLRAEEEFATTLVCAVIEPAITGGLRAYLTGVGDSGAWLLSSGMFTELLGGKAISETGLTSATVTALPQVPTDPLEPTVVDIASNEVLLIGTDGIGDPLGDGRGGVGNLLRELLAKPSPPSLVEFAHLVDFSRELFDDDRTLVAIWAIQPANSDPAQSPRPEDRAR